MRHILLFGVFLFYFGGVFAQQNDTSALFQGGIAVGVNFATLQGDAYSGFHKLAFNGSGFIQVNFWKILAARVELGYSERGCVGVRSTYSPNVGVFYERYKLSLHYVELPCLVYVNYLPRWSAAGGISYARLFAFKEQLESDQPVFIDPELYPFEQRDWAWVARLSYRLDRHFLVDFSYQQSLLPIRQQQHVPARLASGNTYNNWFSLRLLYNFL